MSDIFEVNITQVQQSLDVVLGEQAVLSALETHSDLTSGVHGISVFGATLVSSADAETARGLLGATAPTWGTITGSLSSQADLSAALGNKASLTSNNTFSGNNTFDYLVGSTLEATVTFEIGAGVDVNIGSGVSWAYPDNSAANHRDALKVPASNPTGITGATAVTNIVKLSQANYDAIPVKDPATLYVVTAT